MVLMQESKRQRQTHQRSQFTDAAHEVSRDIQSTSLRLAELTRLVRTADVDGSTAHRVSSLAGNIKRDVERLHATLDHMERVVQDARGGSGPAAEDAKRLLAVRDRGAARSAVSGNSSATAANDHHADPRADIQRTSHSGAVVGSLRTALLGTAADLRQVLSAHTEDVKAKRSRQSRLEAIPWDASVLAPAAPQASGGARKSDEQRREEGHAEEDGDAQAMGHRSVDEVGHSERARHRGFHQRGHEQHSMTRFQREFGGDRADDAVLDVSSAFGQVSEQAFRPQVSQSGYLESRADDVELVHRHIEDLSSVFQRLAGLIAEQDAAVGSVEENVDESLAALEAGESELRRAQQRANDPRRLMMQVMAIVFAFLLVYILFIA